MAVAVVVDWFGPFGSLELTRKQVDEHGLGEGLYFAVGKRKYQREADLQYVGIAGDPKSRLHNGRFPEIKRDGTFRVWLGEVASHAVAGKRAYKHSTTVNLAEWAIAYFLQLPLNVRKRRNPPPDSVLAMNRWFKPDFNTRRVHKGHPEWADLIEYDQPTNTARIAWIGTGGELIRLSSKDVDGYRLLTKNSNS